MKHEAGSMQAARAFVRVLALGGLLSLSACEQPSPGATPPGQGQRDGLSDLVLDEPLALEVERLDPKRPLDAPSDELILRHAHGRLRLVLERHDALVTPGYRTYEVSGGVVRERAAHERPLFCHYMGHVVSDDGALGAVVSVTTCDAKGNEYFSALLRGESRWLELGKAKAGGDGYELSRLELPRTFDDLDRSVESDPLAPRAPGLRAQSTAAASAQISVELLDLNDAARHRALGSTSAAELVTLSVANHMTNLTAGAQLQPQLVLGLVGQLTFVADPYTVTPSAGEASPSDLLVRSATWGSGAPLPEHDVRQLLTGFELEGSTVGLAYVGTMCNRAWSAGIVQASFSTPAVAAIATHELGHTLGMSHDEGLGCGSSFIMAASICTNCSQQPTAFSSCSQASLGQFLSGNVTCLSDPITPASGAPSCGNGVVEAGEQCDCGASNCGTRDACCSGATCQLVAGAACSATQACCSASSCRPMATGATCRAASSSCDLGETCDGSSPRCPADAYAAAGQACADSGAGGLCYKGACVSRVAQCTAAEASYPQLAPPLTPCESTTCGTMRCRTGSSCFLLNGSHFANGTPCGAGRQCDGSQCVPSSQLEPPAAAQPAPALGGTGRVGLSVALLALGLLPLRLPRASRKTRPATPRTAPSAAGVMPVQRRRGDPR